MTRRLWGLTTRQTVVAGAAAALIGIVIGVILGPGHRDVRSPTHGADGVDRVEPGTRASASAVWVFGFETLRFDAQLRNAKQLAVTGFGYVAGHNGAVYMYDPDAGRVGVLDARRNRLDVVATLPPGTAQDDLFVPTIAVQGRDLWLVSAPGQLTRLDLDARKAAAPIGLRPDASGPSDAGAVATGVVATRHGVFTATQRQDGIELARIDPVTNTLERETRLDTPGDAPSLDGFAADGTRVWVVMNNTIREIDASTLTVSRTLAVPSQPPGGVRAAVAAARSLWLLTDAGATLTRLDPDSGVFTAAVHILGTTPDAFRTPASLATDGHSVWAMVQRASTPDDRAVRAVGFDPTRNAPTRAVDIPSRIFPGALAAS